MTHCGEKWVNLAQKHPEVCKMSERYRRRIDSWIDTCEGIVSKGFDRDLVFKKFPEGAHRELPPETDALREKALNHVCALLKKGEKINGKELKEFVDSLRNPGGSSCPIGPNGPQLQAENRREKPVPSESKTSSSAAVKTSEFVTGTQIRDGTAPDPAACQPSLAAQAAGAVPPVPAAHNPPPCKGGGGCPKGKFKVDKVRGNICDAIGAPINQLPGNICPHDAKLERKTAPADTGFKRASEIPAGGLTPITTPLPPDRTLTITFPPDEWEILKNVQRAGEADGFEAAVHVIIQRAGGA